MIEARGLTKTFGQRAAIDHVDLDVRQGVCFGFLGPNGAGKTTLIRLMLGLATPSSGHVKIDGKDVASDPRAALGRVGAIVEEPRFMGHMSGADNLRTHAALLHDPAHATARIPEMIELVGLQGREGDKVKTYSMGMRQRLGVARAMLGDPALLVLDEPTNGLDAEGVAGFRQLARRLVEEERRTVFLSSHLLDEMQKVCDEVAIVEEGRVVTQTSVQQLLRGEGPGDLVLVADDPAAARVMLEREGVVVHADEGDRLRLADVGDRAGAIEVTKLLVQAGIGVVEVRPAASSLERRYLDITRRAGEDERHAGVLGR